LAVACAQCAAENPPGQKFCNSCGEPMAAASGPAREPRSYTPRHLVEKVLTSRSALEGERKQVTVLFADLVDSMVLAEKVGAEEWHRILDRFFQILAEEIHRFEGTINQFTGDGVMALFGAPVAHEDHARRACHAALRLTERAREYAASLERRGLPLSVRMGLNSGDVVVGKIGDDLRMDYTAQGHSVGLAARAEQLAAPGTVFLTEHTAALVEGFFEVRDRGTAQLKGVRAPVRMFELAGVGPLRTRLDASGARGFSRLVGREAELAWLDSILARTSEAHGHVVGVVADAGVGKSRLCLEFVTRCRARGIAVHEAHCPAHGATVPLLPIRELFRSYFRLGGEATADEVRRDVADRLRALDRGFEEAVPAVLDVLGIADHGPDTSRAGFAEALPSFLRRFVRLASARAPVVVLLDDAHWIDRASDELVRELVAAISGTRTLLVANFRPEFRPDWIGGAHYHQLSLAPLSEVATRELVAELLGSDESLGDLPDRIGERTGGNPFFVEEIVRALAAAGSLAGSRGAYRLAAPLSLALPMTVQSLLAARVDRLGERAKHVLQAAAVIGKVFDEPLVEAVTGLADRDVAAALTALQDAELVHLVTPYPQPEYAFRHPLTLEVAYQSQLGERRARMHAAVAQALEKLRADRLGEYASLIAHHWETSGMRFEAARWKHRAALKVSNIKLKVRRPTRLS
jgi:class 3 adenylate cyclase